MSEMPQNEGGSSIVRNILLVLAGIYWQVQRYMQQQAIRRLREDIIRNTATPIVRPPQP